MTQVFVVFTRRGAHEEPTAAFSLQTDAESYCRQQNFLEKGRHPHPALEFETKALDVR